MTTFFQIIATPKNTDGLVFNWREGYWRDPSRADGTGESFDTVEAAQQQLDIAIAAWDEGGDNYSDLANIQIDEVTVEDD